MSLATQLLADPDTVFLNTDEFADTVTYTTAAGVAKSIKAVLEPIEFLDDRFYADGRQVVKSFQAFIDSDATLGIAAPARGDSITFNSVAYKVDKSKGNDKGMHELVIVRNDVIEKSDAPFRIPSRN